MGNIGQRMADDSVEHFPGTVLEGAVAGEAVEDEDGLDCFRAEER